MKFLNFGSIYKLCVVQWGYQDVYGFATGNGGLRNVNFKMGIFGTF